MSEVRLEWHTLATTNTGQRLYRSTEPFTSSDLPAVYKELDVNQTSFKDQDVLMGVKYYYMISNYSAREEKFSGLIEIDLNGLGLGPGPQNLIGSVNEDLGPGTNKGFFGETSSSELITGNALASLLGLTAGESQHSDAGWLKYMLDGRVLYIAKRNFRHTLSWDAIRAVNAVYGDRVLQIGDYQFKVGLLKGADTDPATYTGGGFNVPGTLQSEWTRLLYPTVTDAGITNSAHHKTGQIGNNWAEYTQADLNLTSSSGNGSYSWCQETMGHDAGRRVRRGLYSVTHSSFYTSSYAGALYGWRPRLELVTS